MPTTAIFENSDLADAVGKAARIAPIKGAKFDKAAGILMMIEPAQRICKVRATDLDVFYEQSVPIKEVKGDAVNWRIPSGLLAGFIMSLPMGTGNDVTFIDRGQDTWLRFQSDRKKARLAVMAAHDYPKFDTFPLEGMSAAQDLAAKVEQVAWACDPRSTKLAGVHINGSHLIGCNGYVLAIVPAVIPIEKPVTVPLSSLESLLKDAYALRVRAEGRRFIMSLDEKATASSTLLMEGYPDVFKQVVREDFIVTIEANRQQFADMLNGLMVLIKADKLPTLRLEVNGTGMLKMLTFDMEIPDVGRIQDSMDISTEYEEVFDIYFPPRALMDAISHSKADKVKFALGHPEPEKSIRLPCLVSDDQGYTCYVSPKQGATHA